MPNQPTRAELALVALSWAILVFTILAALRIWISTPR
jgi:hypothetical protein